MNTPDTWSNGPPWKIQTAELFAAIAHESKNKLLLLGETLLSIPLSGEPLHDEPLKEAQVLVRRISGEFTQALILHGADVSGHMYLNAIDAYSPHEFVVELARTAIELSRNNLSIRADADDDLPAVWFFDRNLLQLAIMNAIHNCLKYAKQDVYFQLGTEEGMLKISVSDDSGGYPEHILKSDVSDVKDVRAGTGLGLRFAHLIASAHKANGKTGFVRLRNDGQRAVFDILIP